MPSEIIEPPLDTPNPDRSRDTAAPQPAPAIPPQPRTGSTDDLGLTLEANPDPLLGSFDGDAPAPPTVAEAAVEPGPPRSSAELDIERPLPLQPVQPPGSFEAVDALAEVIPQPAAEAVSEPPRVEPAAAPAGSGSFDGLASLSITPGPPAPLAGAAAAAPRPALGAEPFGGIDLSAPPSRRAAAEKQEPDDDDDYDDEPRGLSLGFLLLLSYASAVTIGLLYVLFTGRTLKPRDEADVSPPADERVDPGRRAGASRRLEPPPPIRPEHLTTLGKALRVGTIEITPVGVTSGSITLKHLIGDGAKRRDGAGAPKLRLRLKNVSKDLVFAPMDEAFLREREAGVTDSYIELPEDKRIEPYPLAVTSEWSIVGQEFKELKPGDALDSLVVSDKDAIDRVAPEMTWRIRLRTGVDQTDTIGVRFNESDITPGP